MDRNERDQLDALTDRLLGAAIQVHRKLGPGLLESTYEACLEYELQKRGLIDLLVGGQVIVEIKAVEATNDVHVAQVLTYLKLSGLKVGLLLNFNVTLLKQGVRRIVNGY